MSKHRRTAKRSKFKHGILICLNTYKHVGDKYISNLARHEDSYFGIKKCDPQTSDFMGSMDAIKGMF